MPSKTSQFNESDQFKEPTNNTKIRNTQNVREKGEEE